jgi:hypothetical protein
MRDRFLEWPVDADVREQPTIMIARLDLGPRPTRTFADIPYPRAALRPAETLRDLGEAMWWLATAFWFGFVLVVVIPIAMIAVLVLGLAAIVRGQFKRMRSNAGS